MRVNRDLWDEETPREAFVRAHETGERWRILNEIEDTEQTAAFDWVAEVAREGELAGKPVSDSIRERAVAVAATLGAPDDCYSLLTNVIGDNEAPDKVRSRAISILADGDEWDTDDRLWRALEAAITDPDVRRGSRRAFTLLREEVPARALNLATAILNDRQDGPGSVAVETLAKLSTPEDETLVETLEALVTDETADRSTRNEAFEAALVEPALDHAVDTGELDPVWELVETADTCWRVMKPVIAGLVERVEQLDLSAVGELVVWLLDPGTGTGTPPSDYVLEPLHDEPAVVIDHLYNERRDEFKSVVLARLRRCHQGATLLSTFEVDPDVTQTVRTTLGRMSQERSGQKLLETLETMDADAAADVAADLLRESHLNWPATNLLLDHDDDRVVGPLRDYLDSETQPETVGSLAVALRSSPADAETVFDAIRDKYQDPQFYRRLQDQSDGYQTGLHDPGHSEHPKHLITHLYRLDPDRARSVLQTDLHDCTATELRLDIFAALRTACTESEWLACCRSLRDDSDARVRYAALRPLAQRQDAAAVKTLAQLVTEPGLTLAERKEAVAVIGAAGTADATTHLIDIVDSDHEYDVRGDADAVRWVAIRELARLETPAAMEYLAQLQEHRGSLGQAAAAATATAVHD